MEQLSQCERWGEDPTKMTVLLAYLSWYGHFGPLRKGDTYKHRFENVRNSKDGADIVHRTPELGLSKYGKASTIPSYRPWY